MTVRKFNHNELELLNDLIDDTVFRFLCRDAERRFEKHDAAFFHDAVPEVLDQLEKHKEWLANLDEETRNKFLFEGQLPDIPKTTKR